MQTSVAAEIFRVSAVELTAEDCVLVTSNELLAAQCLPWLPGLTRAVLSIEFARLPPLRSPVIGPSMGCGNYRQKASRIRRFRHKEGKSSDPPPGGAEYPYPDVCFYPKL